MSGANRSSADSSPSLQAISKPVISLDDWACIRITRSCGAGQLITEELTEQRISKERCSFSQPIPPYQIRRKNESQNLNQITRISTKPGYRSVDDIRVSVVERFLCCCSQHPFEFACCSERHAICGGKRCCGGMEPTGGCVDPATHTRSGAR